MKLEPTTILVVDDEEHVVESLKRTLRHENYEVITHTSPIEAAARLKDGGIDILVSDIDMPEMTGLELIAVARAEHPEVARVLLTGDSSTQSALTAINEGAVHKYLTKPWRSKELRESLRSVVATLEVLRREARSSQVAMEAEEQKMALEGRFPGLSAIRRIEGAYLLNDMRVVESLARLEGASAQFVASSWLPEGDGRTEDLRPQ